jgi:hypothetical protein
MGVESTAGDSLNAEPAARLHHEHHVVQGIGTPRAFVWATTRSGAGGGSQRRNPSPLPPAFRGLQAHEARDGEPRRGRAVRAKPRAK